MGWPQGHYNRITICRSCGEIIKTEKVKSDKRRKPVYSITPPQFCKDCNTGNKK